MTPASRDIPKQKHKPRSRRSPPPHEIAAGFGITLEECSRDLVERCSTVRGIELNRRQSLKPWIMALLIHRFDRGIRDIHELNTDSVYYQDGGGHGTNTKAGVATPHIDLRHVLTPHLSEIDEYCDAIRTEIDRIACPRINETTAATTTPSREEIREILRQQKLALLAKEARRILIDRAIPFRELTGLEYEANVRRLSKQDPSVFLSLFSRAFCISERNRKSTRKQSNPLATDTATAGTVEATRHPDDFSHRRFHPPSLKIASHKKKLRKQREREARKRQANNRRKDAATRHHGNAPALLKEKLRAMSQRNR